MDKVGRGGWGPSTRGADPAVPPWAFSLLPISAPSIFSIAPHALFSRNPWAKEPRDWGAGGPPKRLQCPHSFATGWRAN